MKWPTLLKQQQQNSHHQDHLWVRWAASLPAEVLGRFTGEVAGEPTGGEVAGELTGGEVAGELTGGEVAGELTPVR